MNAAGQTRDAAVPQDAQVLFDEARILMEHGEFAEACPKLEASYHLDPATGTLLNLAFCLENQGTTVAAYRTYQAAQQRALDEGNEERKLFAAARMKLLESKLVRIVFDKSTSEPGFWARCNGGAAEVLDGRAICVVEPGEYHVVYGASGKMPNGLHISAREPGSEFVVPIRPLLHVGPVRRAHVADQSRTAARPELTHPGNPGDAMAAKISFGIAAVGAAGTAYLGWRAKSEWDERNGYCSSGCDERALAASHRADNFAWAANVAGAVTVLSAGVGTYFLLKPKQKGTSAVFAGALTPARGGAMLTATFVQ